MNPLKKTGLRMKRNQYKVENMEYKKDTIKNEEYVEMKNELIEMLESDDRMNVHELLQFIENHWDYVKIKDHVRWKENFYQWEVDKLMYGEREYYTLRELILDKNS